MLEVQSSLTVIIQNTTCTGWWCEQWTATNKVCLQVYWWR